MTSSAETEVAKAPVLGVADLRRAITYLVGVAAAFELSHDPQEDPESLKLLRDIVRRTSRNMKSIGLRYMMSGATIVYRQLHEAYRRYRDDASITQDALRERVVALLGKELTPWQLERATPSRSAMKGEGGPAALAKLVVGTFLAGVSDRQFHTWTRRALPLGEPSPFGVESGGAPSSVKYFISISANELTTLTGEVFEHERVLRETLQAMENATRASEKRLRHALGGDTRSKRKKRKKDS